MSEWLVDGSLEEAQVLHNFDTTLISSPISCHHCRQHLENFAAESAREFLRGQL